MLSFSVNKQRLTRNDCKKVVGGTYNYLYAMFDFSYDWEEVAQNAVFNNTTEDKNFTVPIVGNVCLVPWEVITSPNFTVSLYGFTDTKRITTNEVMVPVKPAPYNADNIPTPPPTPTDYEAYVKLVNEYKEQADAQYQELKDTKAETITKETAIEFPNIGSEKNIYIETSTNRTYRWSDTDLKYYCVGSDYSEIDIISGGKARG